MSKLRNKRGLIVGLVSILFLVVVVIILMFWKPQEDQLETVPTPTPRVRVEVKSQPSTETEPLTVSPPERRQAAKVQRPKSQAKSPIPAVLPAYAYEGERVMGFDIPPRMFVMVEQNAHKQGVETLPPACKQYWINYPCQVEVTNPDGSMTRLRVFHCVNVDGPNFTGKVEFDQKSCAAQRKYDLWAMERAKATK